MKTEISPKIQGLLDDYNRKADETRRLLTSARLGPRVGEARATENNARAALQRACEEENVNFLELFELYR